MILTPILRLTALVIALTAGTAHAQSGRDWAIRSQKASFSYKTLTATAQMTLYRGGSVIGQRKMDLALLEQQPGAHDMGVINITAPASLAGTRLLSWSNDKGDDQQWLETAGSNRARRIGDRGRRASFVNSDFTFEDLLKWQVENYRYELIGKASCPAGTCTQVRATPTARASAYGTMIIDYDGQARISRIQYLRKGASKIWKELVASDYRKVGQSWQPGASVMTNHETGTRTQMHWSGYRANAAIDTAQFRPN